VTSEDIRSEIEKEPFISFRLHLVSGKTVDVTIKEQVEMLQNAVLIFQRDAGPDGETLYDVIALRNIERLEQIGSRGTERGVN
jgi:hypothetical protein